MFDFIIRLSLNNRPIVLALAALLTIYGLFVLPKMPVDVFPDLNRPTVNIMTEAPGMAPEEVEVLVTLPIETVLTGLPGVERVRSSTGIGLSIVYVEFAWDTDIYRNRQLVAEKLALAKERLPEGLSPVMGPIASIMGEIQLLGLSSPSGQVSPIELRTLADWTLRPRLLSVPGVAQVISIGGGVKQYQILLSAEKIQTYQLSLESIEEALSSLHRNTTGGYIDLDKSEFLIRNIGQIRSEEEILNSVVGLHLGHPVLVKDIAKVEVGSQVKRGDGSVNAKPAVILSIQKQPGANTVELTKKIDEVLSDLSSSLGQDVQLERNLFKQSHFIESAISNVKQALLDGTLLLVFVLFIFLANFRTTAITLTAIPLSFLSSLIVMDFFGISLNTMTLGGLAVAIGELVDDAIVDVENVFRRLKENSALTKPEPHLKVVYEASSEIRNSIVLATFVVILVFVPLFQLGGIEGRLFIPLGVAYILALIASLIVSLTVTPVLCSYFLNPEKLSREKDSRLVVWLKNWDRRILNKVLDRPKLIIGLCTGLFILSLGIFPFLHREFLPSFNEGTATINLLARPGISLEESNRLGTMAEELILSVPEVKSVSRRTGRAELDEHAEGIHYSEIDVDFHESGRKRELVFDDLRSKLESVPDVFTSIGQPISHRLDHLMSGVRAQIAIKIFGPELDTLRGKAAEIYKKLDGVEGLVDLQVEQQSLIPQVKIQLLRDEAAQYGLILGDLAHRLESALNGKVLGQVVEGQKIIELFMRFDDGSRSNLDTMQNTTVKIMPDGRRISLGMVADIYETSGPNAIQRENAVRRILVSGNVKGSGIEQVVREIQTRIEKDVELPEGYFIQYGGQFESQKSASRLILILGLISLAGIFFLLMSHFKSSFVAFQVLLSIPVALIGSLVAIYLSDGVLSVASLIAFITLCGIASRNGIMMISHYLHLMKYEGEKFSKDMIIRGSLERLTPVLMTALTAILALTPLAFSHGEPGKEILHPVAVVIIGGLISSTLIDMILTPVIFFNYGRASAEKSISEIHSDDSKF